MLIEALKTMLEEAKLHTSFWVGAVNTTCYLQNKTLIKNSWQDTIP